MDGGLDGPDSRCERGSWSGLVIRGKRLGRGKCVDRIVDGLWTDGKRPRRIGGLDERAE